MKPRQEDFYYKDSYKFKIGFKFLKIFNINRIFLLIYFYYSCLESCAILIFYTHLQKLL